MKIDLRNKKAPFGDGTFNTNMCSWDFGESISIRYPEHTIRRRANLYVFDYKAKRNLRQPIHVAYCAQNTGKIF